MANTDKDVLLSLGFDEATLNAELDKLKAKIIEFFKNLNLTPDGGSPLSGITDTAAVKAFNLEVTKLGLTLKNLKDGLALAQAALKEQKLTDKEVTAATADLTKQVSTLENQYVKLTNQVLNSNVISNTQVNTQKQIAAAVATTTQRLANFSVQQNVANAIQQRSNKFLDSFTFQAGVLGFALIRTGRIMEQFGKSMLTFIKSTNEADAALKVLRDSLESNDFSQGKLDQLRKSFKSVDDALRGAFGTNNIELIQRQGFTVTNIVNAIQTGLSKNEKQLLNSAVGWDRLDLSIKAVKNSLGLVFAPGLENIANTLEHRILPAVDKLVADFQAFSPGMQSFLSTLAVGVPVLLVTFGVLSKIVGLMISGAAVIAKIFEFVTGIATSIGAAIGGGEGGAGLLSGLTDLAGPLAAVLVVVIAIATNARGIRDDLVEAAESAAKSFEKLYQVMSKIVDSKVGRFFTEVVVGILEAITSIITTVVVTALQSVIQVFGALFDIVNSVFDIILALFDSATWTAAAKKISDIVVTTALRILQRLGKVVFTFFEGLVDLGTVIAAKLHLISQDQIDKANEAIARWRTQFVDTKYTVDSTTGAITKETEAIDDNTKATEEATKAAQHNADVIKEQQGAYDALALAVDKAREAALKSSQKAGIQALTAQADEANNAIKNLTNSFKDGLSNIFDAQTINSNLAKVESSIASFKDKIVKLDNEIRVSQKLADIQELGGGSVVQDAIKALNAEAITSGGELTVKLNAIFQQTNLKAVDASIKAFSDAINAKVKDGSITSALSDSLQFVIDQIETISKQADANAKIAVTKADQSAQDAIRTARKAADARQEQLNKEQANNKFQAELTDNEKDIQTKQREIADLAVATEQFRLTATVARQRRVELEIEIARLEAQGAKEKLARELQDLNPNDAVAIEQNHQKVLDVEATFNQKRKEIQEKGNADQARSDEESILNRNKRFKSASEEALKILAPFNDLITKAFAAAFLSPDKANATSVFRKLADDIKLVGGSIPEIKAFADTLANETNPAKLIQAFLGLNAFPVKQELSNTIDELIKQVQAIVLADITTPGKDTVNPDGIPQTLLAFLGLKPGDSLKDAATKISATLRTSGLTGIQDVLGSNTFQSKAEVETALGLLAKAKSIQADIAQIGVSGQRDFLKKITEETGKEQIAQLTSTLTNLESELVASQDRTAHLLVNNEVNTQRDLQKEIIIANAKKEALQAEYNARILTLSTDNADEQKRIAQELSDKLIAIQADQNKKLLELQVAPQKLPPSSVPAGVPGQPVTTTSQPTAPKQQTILGAIGDISGIHTADSAVKRLTDTFGKFFGTIRQGIDDINNLYDAFASGEYFLDGFNALMQGTISTMDFLKITAATVTAQIGQALAGALEAALKNGENFFAAFGRLLGQQLINMGLSLISMAIAATAMGAIWGIFTGDWSRLALALSQLPGALIMGGALVALGASMGGLSSGASKASGTSTANAANAKTGAVANDNFDPAKDIRTIYQKALMAQITIDVKTDDTQIVKTIIKSVNGNGRLATLIGNRKLQFGY